jgi:hypothetical protein
MFKNKKKQSFIFIILCSLISQITNKIFIKGPKTMPIIIMKTITVFNIQ